MNTRKLPTSISGFFWLLAVALVALLGWRFHRESTEVLGIAEASETIVSAGSGVEILEIRAAPGQPVHAGDTLALLLRPELESRIHDIELELQHAMGTANLSASETDRRVSETRSAFEARSNRANAEIARLRSERDRNRQLVSGFLQGQDLSGQDTTDPTTLKIAALRREIEVDTRSTRELVALLRGSRGDQSASKAAMQEAMQKELSLLRSEQENLKLRAQADGIVGEVHFRVGEKVAAFSPILTISDISPTLVRGYIHESLYSRVALGDSMEVASSGQRAGKVRGIVGGTGSKIVEFPVRLRKNPLVPIWGRELIVRIPSHNPFLLNEMVTIRPLDGGLSR